MAAILPVTALTQPTCEVYGQPWITESTGEIQPLGRLLSYGTGYDVPTRMYALVQGVNNSFTKQTSGVSGSSGIIKAGDPDRRDGRRGYDDCYPLGGVIVPESGDYKITVFVISGGKTFQSPTKQFYVNVNKQTLLKPQWDRELSSNVIANQDYTISWRAVSNAQKYRVYFTQGGKDVGWDYLPTGISQTVKIPDIQGTVYIGIIAMPSDYNKYNQSSELNKSFSVWRLQSINADRWTNQNTTIYSDWNPSSRKSVGATIPKGTKVNVRDKFILGSEAFVEIWTHNREQGNYNGKMFINANHLTDVEPQQAKPEVPKLNEITGVNIISEKPVNDYRIITGDTYVFDSPDKDNRTRLGQITTANDVIYVYEVLSVSNSGSVVEVNYNGKKGYCENVFAEGYAISSEGSVCANNSGMEEYLSYENVQKMIEQIKNSNSEKLKEYANEVFKRGLLFVVTSGEYSWGKGLEGILTCSKILSTSYVIYDKYSNADDAFYVISNGCEIYKTNALANKIQKLYDTWDRKAKFIKIDANKNASFYYYTKSRYQNKVWSLKNVPTLATLPKQNQEIVADCSNEKKMEWRGGVSFVVAGNNDNSLSLRGTLASGFTNYGNEIKFKLEDKGNGYCAIKCCGTGKVLSVYNNQTDNNSAVVEASYTGASNQLWSIEKDGVYRRYKSKSAGKYLSASQNKDRLVIYAASDTDVSNIQWGTDLNIGNIKVSSISATPISTNSNTVTPSTQQRSINTQNVQPVQGQRSENTQTQPNRQRSQTNNNVSDTPAQPTTTRRGAVSSTNQQRAYSPRGAQTQGASQTATLNQQQPQTYTTSNFTKVGDVSVLNHAGRDYIGMINAANGFKFTVSSTTARAVTFNIVYRSDNRGGQLKVNGRVQNVSFPSTGWNWGTKDVQVQLRQGINTIEFYGGYQTEYAPDIAEITVTW